ncbi:hypothetical protein AO369_1979 [Moraxella catarrhalis]|nr:hypothetical protein AO369_1979 [Moraxella catarrhalis]
MTLTQIHQLNKLPKSNKNWQTTVTFCACQWHSYTNISSHAR